ncbi:MAG: tyrosine-type recombinase/integrase [Steroidobacteraceae bacterium]
MERLLDAAAASGRHGPRDRTLLLSMYRRGLRVSEAISLRWDQVNLKAGHLTVRRRKNGVPSTHPLRGRELRAMQERDPIVRGLDRVEKGGQAFLADGQRRGVALNFHRLATPSDPPPLNSTPPHFNARALFFGLAHGYRRSGASF